MQLKKRIYILLVSAFLFVCGCALELSVDSRPQFAPIEAQHALLVGPEAEQLSNHLPQPEQVGTQVATHHAGTSYSWL